MSKETKSVSVVPSLEQSTIDKFQRFGWELLSSQEVNNSNTELYTIGDTVYQETTKENYVKLVFTRDTQIPHYEELKKLEYAYDINTFPEKRETKWRMVLGVFATIIGCFILLVALCAALVGIESGNQTGNYTGLFVAIYPAVFGIALPTLGVFLSIKHFKKRKLYKLQYEEASEKYFTERKRIMDALEALKNS